MPQRRRIPLKDLVARGPVLSARQRVAFLAAMGPSGVTYTGTARLPHPVMPLQAFGVAYDLDLVMVDDSPDWDMHEYARVVTPDGPVWMCKDSRVGTLEQTIVADLADLDTVLPEVPLKRRRSVVGVEDRGDAATIDLALSYDNFDGKPVRVTYRGPMPTKTVRLRNSSTMGHSAGTVLAALDVSAKSFAKASSVTIDGVPQTMKKVLGLVPFQLALLQTQAGLSAGAWSQRHDADGVWTQHEGGAVQRWAQERAGDQVVLVQTHPWRTLRYTFQARGDALELCRVDITQAGRRDPPCTLLFAPAIPDLRFAFHGPWSGRWVMDVNGQEGHATGRLELTRDMDADHLRVLPDAPRWTLDRPLLSEIRMTDDGVTVRVSVDRP